MNVQLIKKLSFILLLCSLGLVARAQQLKIRVTDRTTGLPLAGAIIKVNHTAITATTGSDGFSILDHLTKGSQELIISAEGYQQMVVHVYSDQKDPLNIALDKFEFTLKEVAINARVSPRSDQQSRLTEQNAVPLVDIASGDLIEHSGSISAGDVVQHISGLSITHTNTGNSDKAIVRGMEAKYSYILVNGIKIPSPDDKSRYVSLDLFPAGLLQSVQVYKTLTADMEGDAIGGAVNLVMRQPGDEPFLQVDFGTGYSERFFSNKFRTFNSSVVQDQSPYERLGSNYYATGADFTKDNLSFRNMQPAPDVNFNMVTGRQFLHNKLGVIASADYKNIKTGSDGFYIPLNVQPNLNNVPAFSDFYRQTYNNNKIAFSTFEQVTYRPDSLNNISLNYFYINQRDIETRSLVDTSLALGRSEAGTGRIYVSDRSRVHEQQINNLNLKGDHTLGQLSIDWAGVFSQANGRYPDWSQLTYNTGRLVAPDGSIQQAPVVLAPLNRIWLSNKERDLDGFLDLHYKPAFLKQKLTLSAGGVLRNKKRDNFYNTYTFTPNVNEPFTDIYGATWQNNNGPQNPLGNVNNPNTYSATEHIDAGYLMADWQVGRSEFNAGIRFEQTTQNFVSALDPTVSFGKIVNISYRDWLPDFHWKYILGDDQQLKASYFKGISRPALYDITFQSIAFEDYTVAGNPFLIRTRADNLDLTYTWNQTRNSELKVSIFYKHLVDAYEKTLLNGNDELYPIPQNGLSYTPAGQLTEQLRNTGDATNYGAEVYYTRTFGNFTLGGSYTYTSSSITRQKKLLTREVPNDPTSNEVTVTEAETGPLEGQSKHLANINLLYKKLPGGWQADVAVIYTGKRIDLLSTWYGLDYWQRANVSVNLNLEKKLSQHFKLRLSANNLFNNGIIDDILVPNPNGNNNILPEQTRSDRITILKQDFSAYFLLGLRYEL